MLKELKELEESRGSIPCKKTITWGDDKGKVKDTTCTLSELVRWEEADYGEWNGYTICNEEVRGGGEGDGEEYWFVFSLTKDGVTTYYQVDGYYQSHHGSEADWDTLHEVRREEVMVYKWFPVKKDV